MGSDWRGPCHVPAETIKKWEHKCTKCGKVVSTTSTDTIKKAVPRW